MNALFRGVVVAITAAASVGCIGPGPYTDWVADRDDTEKVPCKNGAWSGLDGLNAAHAFDGIELRELEISNTPMTTRTLTSSGTLCATAQNKAACLERAAAAKPPANGFGVLCRSGTYPCRIYLVVSRGDELEVISHEALNDWLGSIDTPAEAALLVQFRGKIVSCSDGVREVADGFEVSARDTTCAMVIHVSRTGMMEPAIQQGIGINNCACSWTACAG